MKLVLFSIGGFIFLMTYLASRGGLANETFVQDALTLKRQDATAPVQSEVRKKSIEREIRALESELESLRDAEAR